MLGELEETQARFNVQTGAFAEQGSQRVVVARGELSKGVELGELRFAFAADDARQLVAAGAGAGDQLEVEVIAVAGRGRRGRAEPLAQFGAGSAVALSGPSGSRKSTLLHIVGALERPDEGTVTVGGRELAGLSRRELAAHRRRVGFVFQRFNLLPALTVIDNVMAPVLPYRVPFGKEARARELLAAVGLEGRETSLPSRLSGGQQQRVAIARALINAPAIVLADEPTGNLDSRTGAGIVDLLLRLRAERAMTVVVATHDSQVAARCDRVVRLLDGRITDDVDVRAAADVDATLRRLGRTAPG